MLEQDYLMKLILQFFRGMVRSWELKEEKDDPELAADMLETAIGTATEMDCSNRCIYPKQAMASFQVSGLHRLVRLLMITASSCPTIRRISMRWKKISTRLHCKATWMTTILLRFLTISR